MRPDPLASALEHHLPQALDGQLGIVFGNVMPRRPADGCFQVLTAGRFAGRLVGDLLAHRVERKLSAILHRLNFLPTQGRGLDPEGKSLARFSQKLDNRCRGLHRRRIGHAVRPSPRIKAVGCAPSVDEIEAMFVARSGR